MSFFVEPSAVQSPKVKNIRLVSLSLAGALTLMTMAQLFTFEDFSGVLANLELPGGEMFAPVWAAFIVTLEVAALPFLLFMHLSRAARVVSMIAGWLAAAAWLKISLWSVFVTERVVNSGLLGDTVSVLSGWWVILFSLIFLASISWVVWKTWLTGHIHT